MIAKSLILIVEDDQEILTFTSGILTGLGFEVETAMDGPTGLENALSGRFDLAIIDVNLPGMSGFDVCRAVRAKDADLPILVVTARTDEIDKVLGLELGADDYIPKPFSVREFEARVRALLRRGERTRAAANRAPAPTDSRIVFGEIEIDLARTWVEVAGKPIHLTALEFELLVFLVQNSGKTFSRDQLMEQVWGYTTSGSDQTLTKHLSRLRTKIETDETEQRYIKTVRGIGYRFAALDEL